MHHPLTALRHPLSNNQCPLSDSGSCICSLDTSLRLCVGGHRRLTTGSRSPQGSKRTSFDRQGLAGWTTGSVPLADEHPVGRIGLQQREGSIIIALQPGIVILGIQDHGHA